MDRSESDIAADHHVAGSRDTGGRDPDKGASGDAGSEGDGGSTTGVDRNQEFVGRVAGADEGYEAETGAEARAEQERNR
ncbi:MAG TPA: hypothetical protein VM367_16790 [Pseudonocardia sp.]|jgi:hypothetical protein|nr:hypothetical protein [Pseudonocardia sp.]